MAFGPIIDVPLLSTIYGIFYKFHGRILKTILKIKLPKLFLAMLISVPLISIEENINCGAFNCRFAVIPPTIYILIVFQLIYLLISRKYPQVSPEKKALYYGVFGILFELIFGVAKKQLYALAMANPLGFILIILWVGFSYWFVIYLPLQIIQSQSLAAK
jgi:hypothetical protein